MDMTLNQLYRAVDLLLKGKLIPDIAATLGVDGELIARATRHYGYYKPDGTFFQDRLLPRPRAFAR